MFTMTKQLPTVSGVLSTFRKAIADLDDVVQAQSAESAKQAQIAADADAAAKAADAEATNALAVKAKMEAIFN